MISEALSSLKISWFHVYTYWNLGFSSLLSHLADTGSLSTPLKLSHLGGRPHSHPCPLHLNNFLCAGNLKKKSFLPIQFISSCYHPGHTWTSAVAWSIFPSPVLPTSKPPPTSFFPGHPLHFVISLFRYLWSLSNACGVEVSTPVFKCPR